SSNWYNINSGPFVSGFVRTISFKDVPYFTTIPTLRQVSIKLFAWPMIIPTSAYNKHGRSVFESPAYTAISRDTFPNNSFISRSLSGPLRIPPCSPFLISPFPPPQNPFQRPTISVESIDIHLREFRIVS